MTTNLKAAEETAKSLVHRRQYVGADRIRCLIKDIEELAKEIERLRLENRELRQEIRSCGAHREDQ